MTWSVSVIMTKRGAKHPGPSRSAFDLKKAWPDMDLRFIPDAGHSARETGIKAMLVKVGRHPPPQLIVRPPTSSASYKMAVMQMCLWSLLEFEPLGVLP